MRQRENEKLLEREIKRSLESRARQAVPDSGNLAELRRRVYDQIEEESGMRKWSMRKVVVAAAAICVFASMTAVAAGLPAL